MELPVAVGTVGGSLKTNPTFRFALALLGNPRAQVLAQARCSCERPAGQL
jgi:hydroxymethylglutaryl-CoA reductase